MLNNDTRPVLNAPVFESCIESITLRRSSTTLKQVPHPIMPVIRAVVSDENPVKQGFLLPEDIVSLLTAMISLPIISVFFWQRLQAAQTRGPSVASVTLLLVSNSIL